MRAAFGDCCLIPGLCVLVLNAEDLGQRVHAGPILVCFPRPDLELEAVGAAGEHQESVLGNTVLGRRNLGLGPGLVGAWNADRSSVTAPNAQGVQPRAAR
jgi:hypothetical protein